MNDTNTNERVMRKVNQFQAFMEGYGQAWYVHPGLAATMNWVILPMSILALIPLFISLHHHLNMAHPKVAIVIWTVPYLMLALWLVKQFNPLLRYIVFDANKAKAITAERWADIRFSMPSHQEVAASFIQIIVMLSVSISFLTICITAGRALHDTFPWSAALITGVMILGLGLALHTSLLKANIHSWIYAPYESILRAYGVMPNWWAGWKPQANEEKLFVSQHKTGLLAESKFIGQKGKEIFSTTPTSIPQGMSLKEQERLVEEAHAIGFYFTDCAKNDFTNKGGRTS